MKKFKKVKLKKFEKMVKGSKIRKNIYLLLHFLKATNTYNILGYQMCHEVYELMENDPKFRKQYIYARNINLAVIGHVDSGKSTTMGNLMYKNGDID